MKKVILLTLAGAISFGSFAQKTAIAPKTAAAVPTKKTLNLGATSRTTGNGDTLLNTNIQATDTLAPLYYAASTTDSGFISGPDGYGLKGFAERLSVNGADSSVQVIGMIGYFLGKASATSTMQLNMKVWSEGAREAFSSSHPGVFYSGFPNTVLASASVPLTSMRASNGTVDTLFTTIFPTATTAISGNYFVGYDVASYVWGNIPGDTVGLIVTKQGSRHIDALTYPGTDTVIEVANTTQLSDGTWLDNFQDIGFFNTYFVYSIVKVTYNPAGVNNVVKNGLTFFGNYPNPAVNNTNIKIGLKNAADVNIQILDMAGRVINTINQSKLGAGEHVINVETANLAAGNYIYTITTSAGDRLASQMSVVK